MGDGEVRREDGHGIAEDQVVAPVEDSFLGFRETIETEETSSVFCVSFVHASCAALDSTGIVLEANGKPFAGDIPLPDVFE